MFGERARRWRPCLLGVIEVPDWGFQMPSDRLLREAASLGEGDVDVGLLLDALEAAGYSGWYVLEQDTVVESEPQEGEGPILNVGKSLAFVEERLNGGAN